MDYNKKRIKELENAIRALEEEINFYKAEIDWLKKQSESTNTSNLGK